MSDSSLPRALRLRSLLLGVLASNVLGATIVIAGLKAGITPGVSPIVVLITWALLSRALRRDNASEALNIAQIAGSAGAMVAAGVIFTAPLLPILARSQGIDYDGLDTASLVVASLTGSLIGFGWVGLNARKVLMDPTLPAPEAKACAGMIHAAAASLPDEVNTGADDQPRPTLRDSLLPGLIAGFTLPLTNILGFTQNTLPLLEKKSADGVHTMRLELPLMPIYIGIGALLSLATALVVFGGSVARLTGDFILASTGSANGAWPDTSMRWVGGAAMTVAVLASLVRVLRLPKLSDEAAKASPLNLHTLVLSPGARRGLFLSVAIGSVLLLAGILTKGSLDAFTLTLALAIPLLTAVLVTLGALLSLQIGSSASPVSGTVFLMTLLLCLIAIAFGRGTSPGDLKLLTFVLVSACVAVCASNDSSQDFKTLELLNLPIQRGLAGQFWGLVTASITIPVVLITAERAYGLGSDALPAPQGQLFAMLMESLLFEGAIPKAPLVVGGVIGVIAVAIERWGRTRGLSLPSMAFAIGLYLPPYLGVGLVIGALARELGRRRSSEATRSVLFASGLITGAAGLELLIGGLLLAQFDPAALALASPPAWITNVLSVGALAVVCLLLARSARLSDAP